MSRLIIVIMQEEQYPFGQCDNTYLDKKKVMVRKRVQFHPFQKKNILLKAKKIKSFINPYIIKLQQLLQEQSSLHLLFQYIPIKIQTWISNINTEFIENFRSQLLQLADYLAENSIVIDFKLKNIGMDQNYQPKYFIGLDYQINTMNGKDLLIQKYKAQIGEILNPYNHRPFRNQEKAKSVQNMNPEFSTQKINQSLKRQNEKSVKEINQLKNKVSRSSQISKVTSSQRDSINKVANLSQSDMKLTFDGSQKILFEKLPKNISTNIKIEHIGRKINDLKNKIRQIGTGNKERKHDSVSLSPKKEINGERPNSSYQKGLQKLLPQPKISKGENLPINGTQNNNLLTKQLRQTQSQSQYSGKISQNIKCLDKANQRKVIEINNEVRTKNQVRVNGPGKQSYIFEFERLLNDDIDSFAFGQKSTETNLLQTVNDKKFQLTSSCGQQKSPRFGFSSTPIEIEFHKTEPERFSYSHTAKRRKKSTESSTSNTSQIQDRVNAVIGASRKLISNFRKGKPLERKEFCHI